MDEPMNMINITIVSQHLTYYTYNVGVIAKCFSANQLIVKYILLVNFRFNMVY